MRALTLLGSEVTLTTAAIGANNVNSARIIRLVVTGTTSRVVTLKTAAAVAVGTITVVPYEQTFIAKGHTDTLELSAATGDVFAAPISFF